MVKKALFFLLSAFCLFSCADHSINIKGHIKGGNYDGRTAYLYVIESSDLSSPTFLTKATVTNGEFEFNNIQDEKEKELELPTIAFLSLFDLYSSNEDSDSFADLPTGTVILEEGTTNIIFDGTSVMVSGTANNEKFNQIHQVITSIAELANLKKEYGGLDNIPADDTGRDGRAQLQLLNQKFSDVTYNFAKENMTNNIGHFLFYSYAENMFTPSQILDLINLSDSTFRSRKDITNLYNDLATMKDELNQSTDKTSDISIEKIN